MYVATQDAVHGTKQKLLRVLELYLSILLQHHKLHYNRNSKKRYRENTTCVVICYVHFDQFTNSKYENSPLDHAFHSYNRLIHTKPSIACIVKLCATYTVAFAVISLDCPK